MNERKQIKDFKVTLKDMESMVRDPRFLWNGRDMDNFSMRPREVWGNWLLCVVFQKLYGENRITFSEDGDDGTLIDKESGAIIATEHVSALNIPLKKNNLSGEAAIINEINKKITRGQGYAEGKILVILFDGVGKWHRNKVRAGINWENNNFINIFGIGHLVNYAYSVTHFFKDKSISFKVQINKDFTYWTVKQMV